MVQGYEGLLEKESFPFYVLFMEVDPGRVDVNVHPTKQEVKFEDDRMMYAYLNSAVKHALARYNIAPSLDFTLNPEIQQLPSVQLPYTDRQKENIQKGYLYNAFSDKDQAHLIERKDSLKRWKELYEIAKSPVASQKGASQQTVGDMYLSTETSENATQGTLHNTAETDAKSNNMMLIHGTMLVTTVKSGLMLIHIRRAQERIWYERLLEEWNSQDTPSQQVLFPIAYEVPPQDAILLTEVLADLARIGFDIAPFGKSTFVVQGIPSGLPPGEEKNVLDEVLDHLKHESPDAVNKRTELLLIHMARRLSRNKHTIMQPDAQQALIDELFACSQPEYTPDGKKVFVMIKTDELEGMLG